MKAVKVEGSLHKGSRKFHRFNVIDGSKVIGMFYGIYYPKNGEGMPGEIILSLKVPASKGGGF